MVDELIQSIYDKTVIIVKDTLIDSQIDYEESYLNYLKEKYSVLLMEFASEESDSMIKAIVDSYIEDETNIWKALNKNEMLSILEKDLSFEHLSFLSNIAFEQAKECKKTDEFLSDENAYQKQLEELASCLDSIKPYNVGAAKELLSEAILDIEYAFNKSTTMSLRLSRIK